ncbi:MAG: galactose oxidase [Xanthomonadales bacterium]|nr:galactose oxidase [Xanthomonadales bacterium]
MIETDNGARIYSFQGLLSGKRWSDIHARTWAYDAGQWSELDPVPVREGRLAGAAIGIDDVVWLFGGYTVAEDGAEVSTPEVFRLNSGDRKMEHVSDMPVPVDDMAVFAYQGRYIYLVSGWHDLGNVNLVQVLDTRTMAWSQATPYPGAPVFGHAGGLYGGTLLLCGGVRIEYPEDGSPRRFLPSRECWLGEIDSSDFRRIAWQSAAHHPGPARYRAAAVADDSGHVVFAGGTDNPYNFDGIGYNGIPSAPLANIVRFNIKSLRWDQPLELSEPSMDHRALLFRDGWFYLVGGMLRGQRVSDRVLRFRLD